MPTELKPEILDSHVKRLVHRRILTILEVPISFSPSILQLSLRYRYLSLLRYCNYLLSMPQLSSFRGVVGFAQATVM